MKAHVFNELHPEERVVPAERRAGLSTCKRPHETGVAIWLGTYEARAVVHYAY